MSVTYYSAGGSWSGRLWILARPRGGDWLEEEVHHWTRLGVDVVVSLLTASEMEDFNLTGEEMVCRSNDIEFVSFPIPDRGVPSSHEALLSLVSQLDAEIAKGKTVGIHCRQGIGRSGLLAACLLVLNGLSWQAAFERLTQARGHPVPETSEQRQWVEGFAPVLARQEK